MSEGSADQAGRPTGLVGRVFGEIMAWTNHEMNLFTLEHLGPLAGRDVLEIGFGPGRFIESLAAAATRQVAGIDISATMVAMASRRNRRQIGAGRVRLLEGSVEHLPFPDASFDVVCAVNTFQFWPVPRENLREVRRVLRPEGLVAITLRAGAGSLPIGFGGLGEPERIEQARENLSEVGFHRVRVETATLRLVSSSCVLGEAV